MFNSLITAKIDKYVNQHQLENISDIVNRTLKDGIGVKLEQFFLFLEAVFSKSQLEFFNKMVHEGVPKFEYI